MSHATWHRIMRAANSGLALAVLGGCATMGPELPRMSSYAIDNTESTTLSRAFEAQASQNPILSGFQVVVSGHAAFGLRAALADTAERTLDLQYYLVTDSLTADLLLLRLIAAAERGVRVRILLDDIHVPTRVFARRAIAAHPNIQVRLFNPFLFGGTSNVARLAEFVVDGERLNRRMHNKLWVADNAAAVVGSRNIGDEYFDADATNNFSDVDLLAAGPIVTELSDAFDAYWNSSAAVLMESFMDLPDAAEGERVRQALDARLSDCAGLPPCLWLAERGLPDALRVASVPLVWARAQLVYDLPDRDKASVPSGIEHGSIDDRDGGWRTSSEMLIVSPYFVPSEDGMRHLGAMRERGVRVAVLTSSLAATDSPIAHAGYARHRVALLRQGVELFEMRSIPDVGHRRRHLWGPGSPASIHAKIVVQDRSHVIVGSQNQDPRSRIHNTEAWIALESEEVAAELVALFEEGADPHHAFKVELNEVNGREILVWRTDEDGTTMRYDVEPMTSVWLRLWRGLLGIMIPEHML